MSPASTFPDSSPITFAGSPAARRSRSGADMAVQAEVRASAPVDVGALLTELLSVASESGEEAAVASLLFSRLVQAGFDVDVDAAGNVIASWGDGPETVALVG